jgi:rRNA maturation protein Nop10
MKVPRPDERETYSVAVQCQNCGTGKGKYALPERIDIPKGVTVVQARRCPDCGCMTLVEHGAW